MEMEGEEVKRPSCTQSHHSLIKRDCSNEEASFVDVSADLDHIV
jgi:hypothetical protein